MPIARNITPQHTTTPESGQGTLELALCLPLFLLLVLGTAEIANMAWASVQVNNAARAGAGYASISRATAASSGPSGNIATAAKNEAPRLANLQVSSTQVCYCTSSAGVRGAADSGCANTDLTNCQSPNTIQVDVQVSTSAAVTPLVHYIGLPASYTLSAQATMGVQQ